MASAKAGDIKLEYYIEGSGPPLLMIMGMGGQASSWGEPFLSRLQERFTTIRFSSRGTGLSDNPASAFTMRTMADDTAALLDTIGIERPHVLGISMGGMIAQELVINYPERVQGLVLGCTSCGPTHGVSVPAETVARFGGMMQLPVEQRIRRFWEITITPEFIGSGAQFLDEIIATGMRSPTPMETFGRQLAAAGSFDTYDRLPQIKAPTLILHGDSDMLVPPANAGVLARQIRGAETQLIPGVAHMFFWEKPDESAEAVIGFLSKVPVAA